MSTSATTPGEPWYIVHKTKLIIGVVSILVISAIVGGLYSAGVIGESDASGKSSKQGDTGGVVNAQWGSWGECQKDSDGIWRQKRVCTREGENGGRMCAQTDGGKNTRDCPVINGNWKIPEDSDSVCSKKLDASGNPVKRDGREIWIKRKTCDNPKPQNGGAGCTGSDEAECAPVNGNWKTSFDDQVCEPETDEKNEMVFDSEGRKVYSKTIECVPGKYGGFDCPPISDTKIITRNGVKMAKKRCDYTDGRWGEFTLCSLKTPDDGNSDKTISRICILPTLNDTIDIDAGKMCSSDYPIVGLLSNDDNGYVVSASSVDPAATISNYNPWNAFDGNVNTYWSSHDSANNHAYNPATGEYLGVSFTLVEGKTFTGEWLQVQFPATNVHSTFKPIGFRITPRTDSRSPRRFVLIAKSLESNPWKIIYDATSSAEVNNWTRDAKTFTISADINPPGYRIFRLIITRVGNTLTNGQDQKSVQIAEFKMIGIPYISRNTIKSGSSVVSEMIPCSWSPWGAFKNSNNVMVSTGTVQQFVENGTYLDGDNYKQVSYIQLSNKLIYRQRNRDTNWSECKLINDTWQQERTSNITGSKEYRVCTPTRNWQNMPKGNYRIQARGTDLFISAKNLNNIASQTICFF